MSIDSQHNSLVVQETRPDGQEPVPPEPQAQAPVAVSGAPTGDSAVEVLQARPEDSPAPAVETYVAHGAAPRVRTRPRWVVPTAIAAVGLIASGALGYLFYSTNTKLEGTRHQLAVTQLSLNGTKHQLTAALGDAKTKKVTADYVSLYIADAGKVETDYQAVVACNNYATCRTSAQDTLTDMQAFQKDRQSANVPPALSASDSELGDSLSAGIAALQELINGMDSDNMAKIKAGFNKLDDSMQSMAKAEADLGAELR